MTGRTKINKAIIAIDGYSSTGKSTYSYMLASEYGLKHIDTGAMFRAVTLYGLQNYFKEDKIDMDLLVSKLNKLRIDFRYNPDTASNNTFLNNENVEDKIRESVVADYVSIVAQCPEVREFLLKEQRVMGAMGGVVMDGRDIGTVVFPNADLKLFMTASIEERSKRRFKEFQEKGQDISFEEVKKSIAERDFKDENREIAPLKKADDAVLIDNSNYTREETYKKIKEVVDQYFIN